MGIKNDCECCIYFINDGDDGECYIYHIPNHSVSNCSDWIYKGDGIDNGEV